MKCVCNVRGCIVPGMGLDQMGAQLNPIVKPQRLSACLADDKHHLFSLSGLGSLGQGTGSAGGSPFCLLATTLFSRCQEAVDSLPISSRASSKPSVTMMRNADSRMLGKVGRR